MAEGGAAGAAPGRADNDGTRGGQQHPQHTSQSNHGNYVGVLDCLSSLRMI